MFNSNAGGTDLYHGCSDTHVCLFKAMDNCYECDAGYELAHSTTSTTTFANVKQCVKKTAMYGYAWLHANGDCTKHCVRWYNGMMLSSGFNESLVEQVVPTTVELLEGKDICNKLLKDNVPSSSLFDSNCPARRLRR